MKVVLHALNAGGVATLDERPVLDGLGEFVASDHSSHARSPKAGDVITMKQPYHAPVTGQVIMRRELFCARPWSPIYWRILAAWPPPAAEWARPLNVTASRAEQSLPVDSSSADASFGH